MKMNKPNILNTGQGTPVLMLHSSMSSKIQWYRLMQTLRNDFLSIAVDMYGYGDSPSPTDRNNFTLMDEVEFIENLLADIIPLHEPIHIVGHSYGGAVGLCYAHKHRAGKRVKSLTLYEPVAFHLLDRNQQDYKNACKVSDTVLEHIENHRHAEAAEYVIDHWNGAGTFASFPTSFREMLLENATKIPVDFQALFNTKLSTEDYKELTIPVQLMAGKNSTKEALKIIELLMQTLPNNRVNWVDGGHMEPVNQPERVNPIIERFLRSI